MVILITVKITDENVCHSKQPEASVDIVKWKKKKFDINFES